MALFKRKNDKKEVDQSKKIDKVKVDKKPRKTTPQGKEDIKKAHGNAYKNLIRPIITEQTTELGMYNQYIFEVLTDTNKSEIKKSIQTLYGVKPLKINIINMRGKMARYGRRYGKLKNWKKAIVILKSSDKLDVYKGV